MSSGELLRVYHTKVLTSSPPISEVLDARNVREKHSVTVHGLHRLSSSWRYDEYFVEAQLYHGSRSAHISIFQILFSRALGPKSD